MRTITRTTRRACARAIRRARSRRSRATHVRRRVWYGAVERRVAKVKSRIFTLESLEHETLLVLGGFKRIAARAVHVERGGPSFTARNLGERRVELAVFNRPERIITLNRVRKVVGQVRRGVLNTNRERFGRERDGEISRARAWRERDVHVHFIKRLVPKVDNSTFVCVRSTRCRSDFIRHRETTGF